MISEDLIKIIQQEALKPVDPPFKLGSIDAAYASGNPKIQFDGETVVSTKTYPFLSSYQPVTNDRVALLRIGGSYIVIGKFDGTVTSGSGEPGEDGSNPEFQLSTTHIQWRLVGDAVWIDLVPLSSITGPTGETGATGPTGASGVGVPAGGGTGQVLAKVSATDHDTEWVTPSAGGGGAIQGNYVGNGTSPRTISLGVTPKAVFVRQRNAKAGSSYNQISQANYITASLSSSDTSGISGTGQIVVVTGGFTLTATSTYALNVNGNTYEYLAIL